MSEQKHTTEPLCPALLPFAIMDQEMKDLLRFHECAMDDEGYDVPKERMKRLAEIGLLRRVTANFYEHTTFGLSIINGDFQQKSDVEKQRDDLLESLEWLLNRADPEWESESGIIEYAEACKHARSTIASVKGGS